MFLLVSVSFLYHLYILAKTSLSNFYVFYSDVMSWLQVAEGLGKRGVAQTWRILSRLYCDNHTDFQHLGFLPPQSGLQSQLSSRVVSII